MNEKAAFLCGKAFLLGLAFRKGRAVWSSVTQNCRFAQDTDKWITVHPNGPEKKGSPVLLDEETGEVKAGMGSKFNGKHISSVPEKGAKEQHGAQTGILFAKHRCRQKGRAAMTAEQLFHDDQFETKRYWSKNKKFSVDYFVYEYDGKRTVAWQMSDYSKGKDPSYQNGRFDILPEVTNEELANSFDKFINEAKNKLKRNKDIPVTLIRAIARQESLFGERRHISVTEFARNVTGFKHLSSKELDAIEKVFNSGMESAKKCWLSCQRTFSLSSARGTSEDPQEGFCDHNKNVTFDAISDSVGRSYRNGYLKGQKAEKPWATFFHEFGHAVDLKVGGYSVTKDNNFSKTILNSIEKAKERAEFPRKDDITRFFDDFKEEIQSGNFFGEHRNKRKFFAYFGKDGRKLNPESLSRLYNALRRDESLGSKTPYTSHQQISDHVFAQWLIDYQYENGAGSDGLVALSDMFAGVMKNDELCVKIADSTPPRHLAEYYQKDKGYLGQELFANLFSAQFVDRLAYEKFGKIFPEIITKYERILGICTKIN